MLRNIPVTTENLERPIGLLLLHGLTGTPAEMRPVAKHFRRLGYHVECPLLNGHGGDHQKLLKTRWEDWYDGLEKSLDRLTETYEQVYVVGLCMGSLLAVLLGTRMPERVNGVVILSPTLNQFLPHNPRDRFLNTILPVLYKLPFLFDKLYWIDGPPYGVQDPRIQKKITESLRNQSGGISEHGSFRLYLGSFYQLARLTKVIQAEAHQVKAPALVIHSLEDTLSPVSNAQLLYSWLGTKDKALHLLSGCDHVMTIDRERHTVNQLIEAFIKRCSHKDAANPPNG